MSIDEMVEKLQNLKNYDVPGHAEVYAINPEYGEFLPVTGFYIVGSRVEIDTEPK